MTGNLDNRIVYDRDKTVGEFGICSTRSVTMYKKKRSNSRKRRSTTSRTHVPYVISFRNRNVENGRPYRLFFPLRSPRSSVNELTEYFDYVLRRFLLVEGRPVSVDKTRRPKNERTCSRTSFSTRETDVLSTSSVPLLLIRFVITF